MKHIQTQKITVSNDADLILLRQILRQSTRTMGFSPAKQARITAAISEVLRACIAHFCTNDVSIHCEDNHTHALVIECDTDGEVYHRVANQPSVQTAYQLLDDVKVTSSPLGYHIEFRIGVA